MSLTCEHLAQEIHRHRTFFVWWGARMSDALRQIEAFEFFCSSAN